MMIFPLAFADIPDIFHSLRAYVLESTVGIPSLPAPTCLKTSLSDTRFSQSTANSILLQSNHGPQGWYQMVTVATSLSGDDS